MTMNPKDTQAILNAETINQLHRVSELIGEKPKLTKQRALMLLEGLEAARERALMVSRSVEASPFTKLNESNRYKELLEKLPLAAMIQALS